MKTSLGLALLFSLLVSGLSADVIAVSAKVLDRAEDGAAIDWKYVFPSVDLESGETAALHIGETFRYAVWPGQQAEDAEAAAELYEDRKIGLILSLKVVADETGITYGGKAVSTVVHGTSESGCSFGSTEIVFYGKVLSGELVEVQMKGADGTLEVISLHFAQR